MKENQKYDTLIAFIVIGLFGLLIYALMGKEINEITKPQLKKAEVESAFKLDGNKEEVEIFTEKEIRKEKEAASTFKLDTADFVPAEEILAKSLPIAAEPLEVNEPEPVIEKPMEVIVHDEADFEEEPIVEKIAVEEPKVEPVKPKPAATPKKITYPCRIVVGMYQEGKNANRQIYRLKKAGYYTETISRNGYMTVRVKTPCGTNKTRQMLRDIRRDFASDAFIK